MSDGHVAMRAGEGGEERWRSRLSRGTAPDTVPGEGDTGRGGPGHHAGVLGAPGPVGAGAVSPSLCHLLLQPQPGARCSTAGAGGHRGSPPAPAARPPVPARGIWQVPREGERVPASSGAVPAVPAVRGGGMDIQPHCAGECSRGAAASWASPAPIHDLPTVETQLRNSPSGAGTSRAGLERDVVGAPAPRWQDVPGDVPGDVPWGCAGGSSREAEPGWLGAGVRRALLATPKGPGDGSGAGAEGQGVRCWRGARGVLLCGERVVSSFGGRG